MKVSYDYHTFVYFYLFQDRYHYFVKLCKDLQYLSVHYSHPSIEIALLDKVKKICIKKKKIDIEP